MSSLKTLATSKKTAIILSYVSLAFHTVCNLLLTPLYLQFFGLEQYGLYQMIYTVASYILILDFGIKTAMIRYISKYHAANDYESEKNFSAHCLITVMAIIALMVGIGLVINIFLLDIYSSITIEEADTAHQLFIIMLVVISGTVIERFVSGCLSAYEHFAMVNAVTVAKLVIKLILTACLLLCGLGVILIALVDVIVIILSIATQLLYAKQRLHFKIKLKKFELALIIELASFMLPVFLQSIIGYINNYVDKTVLGILTSKPDVAIYAVAMTFVTLFNSLPSAISGVFLPQATKLVYGEKCNSENLTDFIIRPGRYQFMLCSGFVCGFVLFGKEFICLWAGQESVQAWLIALIIMIPNMVPLIQNTVLSILDAMKKRLFRSVVLFLISVINVIVSVILVYRFGTIGAPIGTAFAFVIGYGIIMNVYYQKEIKIQVGRMFKAILSKTWMCLIPPVAVGLVINCILPHYSWISFVAKCAIFVVIYGGLLLFFGLNTQEKKDVSVVFRKLLRQK